MYVGGAGGAAGCADGAAGGATVGSTVVVAAVDTVAGSEFGVPQEGQNFEAAAISWPHRVHGVLDMALLGRDVDGERTRAAVVTGHTEAVDAAVGEGVGDGRILPVRVVVGGQLLVRG